MTRVLLFGAAWSVGLLSAFLMARAITRRIAFIGNKGWLAVLLVAALARLVPNFVLPVGAQYDIASYQVVAGLVNQNEDVYNQPEAENRHPYLPFQMYWMASAQKIADRTHWPYVQVVRLLPILGDIAIAVLLYFSIKSLGTPREGLLAGLLYATNPISVMVSAYHGQFDSIPAFLILLAFLSSKRSSKVSGSWLGLAILNKSWPVLALLTLLFSYKANRSKAWFLVMTFALPLLGIAIYSILFQSQPAIIVKKALGYNWGVGIWGYTYFFRILVTLQDTFIGHFGWIINYGRYLTLGFLFFVWLLRARFETPSAGFLTILIAFFASTHAFSIQYLMWIVPFAILDHDYRWLNRYTIAAAGYMILAYHTLILDMRITQILPWPQADTYLIIPASLPAWLVTVGWLKNRLTGMQLPDFRNLLRPKMELPGRAG